MFDKLGERPTLQGWKKLLLQLQEVPNQLLLALQWDGETEQCKDGRLIRMASVIDRIVSGLVDVAQMHVDTLPNTPAAPSLPREPQAKNNYAERRIRQAT
jgi:hypothetical protein